MIPDSPSLDWLKVSLHHPPAAAEAVADFLFEAGAQGVWEDHPDPLGRQVTRAGFPPEARPGLEKTLPGLVTRAAAAFEVSAAEFEWFLELERNHDWAEKWKEGLEPVVLNERLAVAPTWWPEGDLPQAEIVLRLDPGLAFGSGHHASTCLCLEWLIELAPAAGRILDLGSGSGILALAAAALNPGADVLGADNDPDTLAVARENAVLNRLADRVVFQETPVDAAGPFDLIAANITLGVLQELAPTVTGLAAGGGRLILSGLLTGQAEEAARTYEDSGWELDDRREREEWSGLVFTRRSK